MYLSPDYDDIFDEDEERTVSDVIESLEKKLYRCSILDNIYAFRQYVQLSLAYRSNEIFAVFLLDDKHRLLAPGEIFHRPISEAVSYAKIIVRKALENNAASVFLVHNHLSLTCEPSLSDKKITEFFQDMFSVVKIKLIDHIIVTREECYSFAENNRM